MLSSSPENYLSTFCNLFIHIFVLHCNVQVTSIVNLGCRFNNSYDISIFFTLHILYVHVHVPGTCTFYNVVNYLPKELGFSRINISFLVILSSFATWQAVKGLSPVIITTWNIILHTHIQIRYSQFCIMPLKSIDYC